MRKEDVLNWARGVKDAATAEAQADLAKRRERWASMEDAASKLASRLEEAVGELTAIDGTDFEVGVEGGLTKDERLNAMGPPDERHCVLAVVRWGVPPNAQYCVAVGAGTTPPNSAVIYYGWRWYGGLRPSFATEDAALKAMIGQLIPFIKVD